MLASYREYIGEPDRERDIYLGFGLFFAGIALGIVGLALFLHSGAQETGSDVFWQSRRLAFAAWTLGLPLATLSVVVLLPVGRRTLAVGALGMAFCVAGTGILVSVYPYQWSSDVAFDGGAQTITVYALGFTLLSVSTGTSLVAQYLDRSTASAVAAEADANADDAADEGSDVTDDEVEADIEAALSDTELSWGGIEKQPNTKRLNLNTPMEAGVAETNAGEVEATTVRSEGDSVDDAVAGLRRLQGGESNQERGTSTEDQVAALTQFREQQAEEPVETGVDEPDGILARIKAFLLG
ncbi:permease [Halobellus sp. Atlit-31R]|nr:permease [Halobellus sp. Atlit-31R]